MMPVEPAASLEDGDAVSLVVEDDGEILILGEDDDVTALGRHLEEREFATVEDDPINTLDNLCAHAVDVALLDELGVPPGREAVIGDAGRGILEKNRHGKRGNNIA